LPAAIAACAIGPCETFAPRALKWLLDRGADLHAAAKYSSPVGMIICIYSRSPRGKSECLEIVEASGFALPDTPVMALHRGRLDLLQEHLDRDPSLLDRRFTFGEVFAVESEGEPGDAYPATPVSGVCHARCCPPSTASVTPVILRAPAR